MSYPFLRAITLVVFCAAIVLAPVAHGQGLRVTLLGTGCPPPVMNRFGPSTLVEAGPDKFLFDAGRGASQRLAQINVPWQSVDGVFLTHLHSDHVVGFPDLWLTGWILGPGRNSPLPVWGPRGTKDMMAHLQRAYRYDVRVRIENERVAPGGAIIQTQDIREGVVYEKGGVRVTAFEVDHGPVKPAFGYRVDYSGHSVVLSGDTRPSEKLIEYARGTDVLIHEVFIPATLDRLGLPTERAQRIVDFHTTPEQAGEVFTSVHPKLAVYSHVCLPTATDEEMLASTRKTYEGPLEIGEDLTVIDVGDAVEVRKVIISANSR
jgi:ribonuclease Z